MSDKFAKWIRNYWDILGVAIINMSLHLCMHTDYWDDVSTTQLWKAYNGNIFQYMKDTYHVWSSRIFIQAAGFVIGALPNIIWKVIDVLMICIWYIYMKKLVLLLCNRIKETEKERRFGFTLFCSFPYALMGTAGWITTTMVYTWTFAATSYFIYLISSCMKGKRVRWYEYLIYGVSVLYAGNFDVTSICYVILFAVLYRKRKSGAYWILWLEGMVISLFNLGLFILAPGNRNRNIVDAQLHNTSEILELSIVGKIRMGINSAFYHFISIPNVVLFLTCFIVAVYAVRYFRSIEMKIVAFLPLGLDVIWTCYMFARYTIGDNKLTYTYPDALFYNCPKMEQYLAALSAILIIGLLFGLFLRESDDGTLFLCEAYSIIIWGILPVIALGFTSTVSTSIIRMVSFLYISFMFCSMLLVVKTELLEQKVYIKKWKIEIDHILCFITICGMSLNIFQTI